MGQGNLWRSFVASAALRVAAPALVLSDHTISFAELKTLALRAAAFLRNRGVRRGDVVALQLPKRAETYALILACLRLGALYTCLDPKNPAERTARMVDRVRPRVLFTTVAGTNPHGEVLVVPAGPGEFGLARGWPAQGLGDELDFWATALDPAYIMFTSGSTGEPKGAVMPHHGVLSLMSWCAGMLGEPTANRYTAINPLHFDNSVFDIYCGLVSGGAIVPVETSELQTPTSWAETIRNGAATIFYAVPTVFLMLDDMGLLNPEKLPTIRAFCFAGEGFPIERLRRFFPRFEGRARLVNAYGPTETSCLCSSIEITQAELDATEGSFASLGYMHKDFDYAVLDDEGRPVAPGLPGELWIGGPCVGLGYYRNAEETARRFRQDPRQDGYRAIYYRSGDLVRDEGDSKLWFVGRADNQVKVGGYRIELEEIDHAAQSVDGVRRAVSTVLRLPAGDEICIAFAADRAVTAAEIAEACRKHLPNYMRPSRVRQLDDIPRNANGKADRLAVRKLFEDETAQAPAPQPAAPPVSSAKVEEIETTIVNVWKKTLNLETVRRGDNFFDLGGTSMSLARVHKALEAELGRTIDMLDLFEHPRADGLASFLAGEGDAANMNAAQMRARRQSDAMKRLRQAAKGPAA